MTDCLVKTNDLEQARAAIKEDASRNSPFHGGNEIYDCETGETIDEEGNSNG